MNNETLVNSYALVEPFTNVPTDLVAAAAAALSAPQSQAVCVLGMHRSGTSMITRLLNLLGVDLGPDDQLMPAHEQNPKGFWENLPLVDLNEAILAQLGLQWDSVNLPPSGWESSRDLTDLRERARQLLQAQFAESPLWGWKDPRTCITLPFWQPLVSNLKYVICLRNPLDVVESLRHRNGFSLEKSAAVWLNHVQASLVHTIGQPRWFVFYEDILSDWQGELNRLAHFLGIAPTAIPNISEAAKEFVSSELQHHATSVLDTVNHPTLSFPVKAQFLALRLYVDSLRPDAPVAVNEGSDRQDALAYFGQWADQSAASQAALIEQAAELQHDHQQLQLEHEKLRTALTDQVVECERLTRYQQQVTNSLANAIGEKEAVLQTLAEKEKSLDALNQSMTEITSSRAWTLMQMLWKVLRAISA
jgi:hypothetical protein